MMYHRDAEIPHSKYYVYLHINPLTQKVFYVGSARGNYLRAYEFDKHRSEKWKKEVLSFGGATNVIVKIVKYFKNPHEAQEYEFKLLCYYRDIGEAYCCDEGDWSFERKNPTLKYVLVHNYTEKVYKYKRDLYKYCAETYGLSRNIVNLIIGSEYNGSRIEARGLKIIKIGKERV